MKPLSIAPLVVNVGLSPESHLVGWHSERRTVLASCSGVILICGLVCGLLLRAMAENQASRRHIELLASGRVTAFEALLRWRHPRLGLVSPAHLIPIAEKPGLIIDIGQRVLNQALAQEARQRREAWRWRSRTSAPAAPRWPT